MASHNPFAQAGWTNSHNPNAANFPPNGQATVLGALPTHFDVPREVAIGAGYLKFNLRTASGYPTILNSTISTPMNVEYIEVVTDKNTTYFRNITDNQFSECFASIEWSPCPIVCFGKRIRYYASQWLASVDGVKVLYAGGKQYRWINEFLYGPHNGAVASIQREQRSVTLHLLSSEVVEVGMRELIVSTVLLQSGRRLD
ncbi:hypothetical protein BDN70DRAFT_871566 [Pholiota conissans]|uniref:DUF6593 domain-containing protein n=1 Tax=Pholiota conissans TaxID=109636 RepID=A0A9P6CYE7_9AGAR|nr:hypothetical protein BDN70DRAFT_871566 [Pholiota conissans]